MSHRYALVGLVLGLLVPMTVAADPVPDGGVRLTGSELFTGELRHLRLHLDFAEAARFEVTPASDKVRFTIHHAEWEGGKQKGWGTSSGNRGPFEFSTSIREAPSRQDQKPGARYTLGTLSAGGHGRTESWYDAAALGGGQTRARRPERPVFLKPGEAAVAWVFAAGGTTTEAEVFQPTAAEALQAKFRAFKPSAPVMIVVWVSVPKG